MAMNRREEVASKIELVRAYLGERGAVRLRGIDWFAWATAGGSNAVLLAAETGVAEVFITQDGAWILTDEIEASRLQAEELDDSLTIVATPWARPAERDRFIGRTANNMVLYSDRPEPGEEPLAKGLLFEKRTLNSPEIERYRVAGGLAAEAMTETMLKAEPTWSEWQLAGAGANALLSRGMHPALVLAAGERRLPRYRHPTPTHEPLGSNAMLVFCARMYGLYANLTRFVSFGPLAASAAEAHSQVRMIEARALKRSMPGTGLNSIYTALAQAYTAAGHASAIDEHHQGGTTGYLSREVVARPDTTDRLAVHNAIAWNPSLTGAKIEDTFIVTEQGPVNMTSDPEWPAIRVEGLDRPLVLER